jgi:Ca-activated chloride channel family protein
MDFQYNEYQILFITLIPLLVILYIVFSIKRKRDLNKIADRIDIDRLTNRNRFASIVKFNLILIIAILTIFTMMRPKWGSRAVSITKQGFEIVFMLDVSPSMLAVDVKPDRLTQAKTVIANIVDELKGNRFALVLFSGQPTVNPPLTDDIKTFKEFYLEIANVEQIPVKGTRYEEAMKLASDIFSKQLDMGRAIIIVSDGEAHDNRKGIQVAEKLYRERGILTFAIGVGTEEGSYIPLPGGRKKLNSKGDVVNTTLERDYLNEIAQKGGGNFIIRNTSDDSLQPIFDKLNRLKKGKLGTRSLDVLKDQYQYFVLIIIALFILYLFIPERRFSLFNLFRKK